MTKRLINIAYSLLGLLYDAVASVGRGATWLLKLPRSNGVLNPALTAPNPQSHPSPASITSIQSSILERALRVGTPSSPGFWYPQEDGRSFVLPVMQQRQSKSEKSVDSIGKEVMENNKQLLTHLAKTEAKEKELAELELWADERMQMEESMGRKYDQNKPQLDLIPVEALNALGEALAYGARKYDRANWAKGIQQSRLVAAALRHLTSYSSGEDLDPESGLSHISHALCNLAFLTYMQKHRPDMDDRWSK